MEAGWRRLPSLVLKGSPQSYRSASETAGIARKRETERGRGQFRFVNRRPKTAMSTVIRRA